MMTPFKWAFCRKKYQGDLWKINNEVREFAIEKKIGENIGFDIDISDPKFQIFNSKVQQFSQENGSRPTTKQAWVHFCQALLKLSVSWVIIIWLMPLSWTETALLMPHAK
jgi:hypothetical protein